MKDLIIFDTSTARRIDANGYLHVAGNRITKAAVNPYYGREVPGWQEAGLDPETLYHGLRAPDELRKAVSTFAGVPLQLEHHPDSAGAPQKLARVGSIGTDVTWADPYVVASLCVWDAAAIEAIESGRMKELSCAYRYVPDFTPGTYAGQRYDFVMRAIKGNHVALVEEGRAGPDVVVADSQTIKETETMKTTGLAQPSGPVIEPKEADLAQAIIDLYRTDPLTGRLVDVARDEDRHAALCRLMDELSAALTPAQAQKLQTALADLARGTPASGAEGRRGPGRDHEGGDLRKAMDACGLDADDPVAGKAFAEGVRFGQTRRCGSAAHGGDGLGNADNGFGLDAAAVRRAAASEARRQMQALSEAARRVRPLCGEVDPFAFDSAQDIYRHALEAQGRDVSRYQPAAWEGMVDIMLERPLAAGSAPVTAPSTILPHLDRFIR